jgi:hypothetical protein
VDAFTVIIHTVEWHVMLAEFGSYFTELDEMLL